MKKSNSLHKILSSCIIYDVRNPADSSIHFERIMIPMKQTSIKNSILLFITASIWGVAFVAQSVSADYIGAFTFNCIRCLMGGLVLIPCIFLLDKFTSTNDPDTDTATTSANNPPASIDKSWHNPKLYAGGIACGILLCIASNLQQIGIQYTTVGKTGFITALYVVFVPIAGLFMKKKCPPITWVSVILSVIGLYLLCMTNGLTLQKGDFFVLICAIVFTFHIIVIDYFVNFVDGVKMSCIQFIVSGLVSGIGMLLWEQPQMGDIMAAKVTLLYAGILSCGVGYTLQIVGQKGVNPTVASLILCLESVISALAGWLILGQSMNGRELTGCILMFTAIVLSQLPAPNSSNTSKRT